MNKLVLNLQEIVELILLTDKDYFDYGFHNISSLLTEEGYRADLIGVYIDIPALLESKKLGTDSKESLPILLESTLVLPTEDNDFCFDLCIQVPEFCQNVQSSVGTDFRLNTLEVSPSNECGANILLIESSNIHIDEVNSFDFEDDEEEFDIDPQEFVQRKGKHFNHIVNTMNNKRDNKYANILHTISFIISEDALTSQDTKNEQIYRNIKRKLRTKND